MNRPLLTVMIPTYGRAEHIGPLLDSILAQDFTDIEIVIAEDNSPRQHEVRAVVEPYQRTAGVPIRFHQNTETLGYDGNFRNLIALARGEFVFVMGDDDRVAPGAFAAVADAIRRYPNLGVIIRAYAVFRGDLNNIYKVTRYWPQECVFRAGPRAIVAAHRRLVAMAGIVMHRDSAARFATDRFDGSIFYQQWLSANILVDRDAVYIPTILAYFRLDSPPIFGTAKREQGIHTPGVQTPETHVRIVKALLDIADTVEKERGVRIADHVRRDFANHIYPTIAHQAREPWPVFYRFYRDLGRLGFNRYPQYHAWFWAIAVIGPRPLWWMMQTVRRVLGYSPNLTPFAKAEPGAAATP